MTDTTEQASTNEPVQIKASELPAYCPTEEMGLWNTHPRVYISLEDEKQGSCPYCGTQFELIEG